MKKITAHSFIIVKIITLFCISNMGLFSVENVVEAKIPCHQEAFDKEDRKDCSACIESLKTWSQDYIQESSKYDLITTNFITLPNFSILEKFENTCKYRYSSYIPPPRVIYVNAFNLAHSSIVIRT